ncbi:MAG: transglutaminase family protein, partial [Wujia sp.]
MAQRQTQIEQVELCEGAYLATQFFEEKENRVRTLLLKGFIVYLLSMGSIGFYLTAFDIAFNVGLCHILILSISLGCAMLYYRLLVENLGYLFLFVTFAALVFVFRDYINSGFYAVVNITVDNAAQYFDVDIQKLYNERIGNRYVTVTFVALFIGIVLDILLNVYISRRMQYATAIVIIMALNLIPLYLVMEPDMLYVIMMLAGVSMAVVFKAGKHYSPQVSIKRDNAKYKVQGKKKREIAYVYDVKAMLQAGAHAALFAVLVVAIVSALKPKESFNTGYAGNKYKDLTMSAMTALLTDGLESFYKPREYNGGISGGKLGTVSTIYLDNETDLLIRMAPYTSDRIYLKSFTGVRYNPYANEWTSMYEMNGYDELVQGQEEAESLKNSYENGNKYSARATMHIQCVGVRNDLYKPYYMYGETENGKGAGYDVTYYPRMDENHTSVEHEIMPYQDADLFVPEENLDAVAKIVDELGFIGTDKEVIAALQIYFQDNYPYTVRPGKTPRHNDFVNYFLTENKKGYCAHFASASVLILRYLGIPARYVEGYAIDYEQILDGELVEGAEYADYYDGYSELGETAYVEIKVTDADAHAWVEVYDPVIGWYPVEMTPYATGEEDVTDFWEEFADFMGDEDAGSDVIEENTNAVTISDRLVKNILLTIVGLLVFVLFIILARKGILYIIFAVRF